MEGEKIQGKLQNFKTNYFLSIKKSTKILYIYFYLHLTV